MRKSRASELKMQCGPEQAGHVVSQTEQVVGTLPGLLGSRKIKVDVFMFEISVPESLRQEGFHEFKGSQGYMVSHRPAWV